VATAFGVEVDRVEVGPQQLHGQPIPLAEVLVVRKNPTFRI
jgi:hypothetical protein